MSDDTRYSAVTAFEAEGARVGLVTCLDCGAAVLLDPRDDDATAKHSEWHVSGRSVPVGPTKEGKQ